MCGRYLIEEEAYSDILEILYRSGAIPNAPAVHHSADGYAASGISGSSPGSAISGSTASGSAAENAVFEIPIGMREAMADTMLGRVSETVSGSVQDLFPVMPALITNGEVFPTNITPVLTADGDGVMAVKWGFPHWKNSSVIINARAETALEKRMFRESLLKRRCVIPSCGFYEWGAAGKSYSDIQVKLSGSHEDSSYSHSRRKKTKYLLRRPDEYKLYMAGFWSTFRDGGADGNGIGGSDYTAFIILTTAANESVSPLHDRMPVILSPDEKDDWLSDTGFMEYALLRPGPKLEVTVA